MASIYSAENWNHRVQSMEPRRQLGSGSKFIRDIDVSLLSNGPNIKLLRPSLVGNYICKPG